MADLRKTILVDVGNTSLKWSWFVKGKISAAKTFNHRAGSLDQFLHSQWNLGVAPDQVLIASVAHPVITSDLRLWCMTQWNLDLQEITSEHKAFGVTNAYTDPTQLGVDRWLTLIAAHRQLLTPACIVDCGTAITLDVIDRAGMHLGGLILPGFKMMTDSLVAGTNIQNTVSGLTGGCLGRNTGQAISLASVYAVTALVEKVLGMAIEKTGSCPRLILTGTDASKLGNALDTSHEIIAELVMHGLSLYTKEDCR